MVLAIEPGVYWPEGGGLRVEDNFLITDERRREALPLPRRDRAGVTIDRDKLWTGDLNRARARAAAARSRRPLRHDAARRRADGRRRALARGQARDRAARSTRRASTGSRPASRASPRRTREAIRLIADAGLERRGLGLRPRRRRPMSRRSPSSASARRWSRARSRTASSRRSASRTTTCSAGSARRSRSRPARGSRSRSSASTARAPTSTSSTARTRAAVEAGAQEASSSTRSGSRRPRPPRTSSASAVDWLDVPVHWHGHDDFGLATAAAVAAVQAGATWVHGTVNGMGERAGNANLLEVALALEALYGIPTRLDLEQGSRARRARPGALRLRARAVDAAHRREPLHPRERRGREPVPRPAVDRAVLVGARRREARHRARQEERPRLDPAEGRGARPRPARRSGTPRCSRR